MRARGVKIGPVKNITNKLILDQNLMSIAFLGVVIMVGAVLRFYDLGAESYWFDEIVTVCVDQGRVDPVS